MITKSFLGKKLLVTVAEPVIAPDGQQYWGVCGTLSEHSNTAVTIGCLHLKKESISSFIDVSNIHVSDSSYEVLDGKSYPTHPSIYFSDVQPQKQTAQLVKIER